MLRTLVGQKIWQTIIKTVVVNGKEDRCNIKAHNTRTTPKVFQCFSINSYVEK